MESVADIVTQAGRLDTRLAASDPGAVLTGPGDLDGLRALLGGTPDVVVRPVANEAAIAFLRDIVDSARMETAVVAPLEREGQIPAGAECRPVATLGEAAQALLDGACVLVDRHGASVAMPMAKWPVRTPAEPPSETVVDGPHNGFVEDLSTNIALLRQRIRNPSLRWEAHRIGGQDGSRAALLYMDGMARLDLLRRVRRALRRSRPRFLTDTLMLRAWLTPKTGPLFPTVDNTGRVDVTVAALMEGRVAVLVDASPTALLAPFTFDQMFHAAEDDYHPRLSVGVIRMFRFGAFLAALLASSVYVALVSMDQELVPTSLYTSIIQARQSVPLAPVLEILVLEVVIEFIQLAGLRLPGSLGQAVSIVGAVIVGQSAVIAGLVSAPSIVVVAFSFIVSFVVPSRDGRQAVRLVRYPMIALAAMFGIFGIGLGLVVLMAYLASLTSFGVPYLAPTAPYRSRGALDTVAPSYLPAGRRPFTLRGVGRERLV